MPASKLNTGALAALIVGGSPVSGFLPFHAERYAVFFRRSWVPTSLHARPAITLLLIGRCCLLPIDLPQDRFSETRAVTRRVLSVPRHAECPGRTEGVGTWPSAYSRWSTGRLRPLRNEHLPVGTNSRHSSPSTRNCSTASGFEPGTDAAGFLLHERRAMPSLEVALPGGRATSWHRHALD